MSTQEMSTQKTPVIVGVGDVVNRSLKVRDAREPADLINDAIDNALKDASLSKFVELRSDIDSIDVVTCWTWPYDDIPGLLANKLGVNPVHKFVSPTHGGNQPALLVDNAARRVALNQAKIAVVCGGEALASLTSCVKEGKLPPAGWTKTSKSIEAVFSATTRELETGLGKPHAIGAPIQIYPLYENAFRAFKGQTIKDNMAESAKLYGDFAEIAEQHPFAWNYGKKAENASTIGTPSRSNRMICFPYPLLMNAFNTVNLAAACVVTSTETAREFGIPEDKWVYPLGGAVWLRPNYRSSPSINQSLDAALEISGLTSNDIDVFDFYSCFPIVPKLACDHLGLTATSPQKPISLLGGLTSFGGAGNNYSMHAITEMVRKIRQGEAQKGLVLANGGWLTYQYAVCLSSTPRPDKGYPQANPLPEMTNENIPKVELQCEGEAVIETYTVDYDRDNRPRRGQIVGRLTANGHRFLANHADAQTLLQLTTMDAEPVGKIGYVKADAHKAGRNLFTFGSSRARL